MPSYPISQINLTNESYPSGITLVIKDADLRTALAAIQALIPSQTTSSNQLADKNFVNSSIATATATLPRIEEKLPIEAMDNFGDVHARSIDMDSLPKVCGYPMYIIQGGTPGTIPDFIGQMYIDTTNSKVYVATAVTAASSWKVLN